MTRLYAVSVVKRKRVLVKKGLSYLLDLYTQYKLEIMEYNEKIRGTGYYVKPIHVTYKDSGDSRLKYIYFGRYWYRVSRKGGRITWIYLGKDKPEPSLPDPPLNPFEGISVIVVYEEDLEVDRDTLLLLAKVEQSQSKFGIFSKLASENSASGY